MKSKIQQIYQLAKEGRGLNTSATRYLFWFKESVEEENNARKEATNAGRDVLLLVNFANNLSNWRSDVDQGHRTIEEYESWIRIARLHKHAQVNDPKIKFPSGDGA